MSVIVFYPKSKSVIEKLNATLFQLYKHEPLEDCIAKEMVDAYYGRMKSIEKHVTTPVHSMPTIYFETEKIAHELGKDFFKPFFDGTIPGCEGFMALQCIDAGVGGKSNASIILFGTDVNGDPLPDTSGYKFFEKWPGRLLSETPAVLQKYFPDCVNEMFSRSFTTNKANFFIKSAGSVKANKDELIELVEAVTIAEDFAQRWEKLQIHIIDNPVTGSGLTDALPGISQNLAFKIDEIEMKALLKFLKPEKIACILCINDNKPGLIDDSLSIMFAGVQKDATTGEFVGKGFAGIEKWPGLYELNEKASVIKNILTYAPDATIDKNEFEPVRKSLDLFEGIWKTLLDDTDGSIVTPRPDILLTEHPIVFFIEPAGFEELLKNGAEYIAGVFGFDAIGKSITPYFVGMDSTNKPMPGIINVKDNVVIDMPILVKNKGKVNNLILN